MQQLLAVPVALIALTISLPAQAPLRTDTNGFPFVRLFTVVNFSWQARPLNNLLPAERDRRVADLTRWYVHFHGESSAEFPLGEKTKGPGSPNTTLAERLAARGVMVSNYRNGSYVSQAQRGTPLFGEAADLETRAPLAIATWWPGMRYPQGEATNRAARLAGAVDFNATTLRVTPAVIQRPPGAPDTWPYIPSRGKGALPGDAKSDSTADFVSWVRVDDEIFRVRSVAVERGLLSLLVDRAFFGTTKAAHTNGTRVMSPVYIGSTTAAAWDRGYAGSPPINNANYALRYAIKIWQDNSTGALKDGIGWIAGRIATTFGAGQRPPYFQGYNAVWLDITSCSAYNTADAYGQPITPWDDTKEYALTPDSLGDHQITKLRGLRSRLASLGYTNLMFTANNLASTAAGADCRMRLLANGGFDAGSLEHWLQNTAQWEGAMNQHLAIQAQDLPAICWLKWNELATGFTVLQYKRFAYGSYLLGWRQAATRPRIGGPFGLVAPDELFFWNFGAAQKEPAALAELQTQPATRAGETRPVQIYRREFANGLVIVNPTRDKLRCDLKGDFYDAVNNDAQGKPGFVKVIELGPADAAFLLKAK
ncbi:MAG TPA: hypothetical protein VI454_04780 [Verrucomicrobiae bacterium]